MARRSRELMAGGVYHVYSRGVRKHPIFLTVEDREDYLSILEFVVKSRGWLLLSYCLMGNHIHLLVETPEPDLSDGMQRLHSVYATRFNSRHGFVGHLFESRYGSARARTEQRIADWSTYIALNPVAAGFTEEPEAWRWGSYGALVGREKAPSWLAVDRLLALFGPADAQPRERFAEAVRARLVLDRLGITPLEAPGKKVGKMLEEDKLSAPLGHELPGPREAGRDRRRSQAAPAPTLTDLTASRAPVPSAAAGARAVVEHPVRSRDGPS